MKSKKFRKNSRKQLRSKKQMKRSRKQKRTRKQQKGGLDRIKDLKGQITNILVELTQLNEVKNDVFKTLEEIKNGITKIPQELDKARNVFFEQLREEFRKQVDELRKVSLQQQFTAPV